MFKDKDKNGIYTPGEGIGEQLVRVLNPETLAPVLTVWTNGAGQFDLRLPSHVEYVIQTGVGENMNSKSVYLASDMYIDFQIRNVKME